jgi:serine/threonine protein kinase
VFAAGDLDGLLYLAMRLVPGCSLADELATSGPLTDDRLVEVVSALAGALDHAHQRGIVHRDVKPANILVEGERVWLTDFGIAATMQAAGRYTTGALGTAAYMAPEQIRPALGEIDGRADLYALGCVIYECVTGRPPYVADDLVALLYAQAQQAIPSTGRVAIDAFMLRALAKNAADRFPSGEVLLDGLREAIAGHILAPVSGGATVPVSRPRPRPGWRRRVGGLVAVVAAVGASYLLTHRHRTPGPGPLATLTPSLVGPSAYPIRTAPPTAYSPVGQWKASTRTAAQPRQLCAGMAAAWPR